MNMNTTSPLPPNGMTWQRHRPAIGIDFERKILKRLILENYRCLCGKVASAPIATAVDSFIEGIVNDAQFDINP